MTLKTSKRQPMMAGEQGSDAEWKQDGKDFDAYLAKQQYSLGAMPTWTQTEEMRRTWCNARKTLREQLNEKPTDGR